MNIHLQFLGATQNVTGSCYLLEVDANKILVDCGLFQEREFRSRNWDLFPVDPKRIDAVLLTHAHLDHCGLLPKLVKEGFAGKIICTPPTQEIAKIVLSDAARIQREDAQFKKKRHEWEGRKGPYPEIPLYTEEDAEKVRIHGQIYPIKANVVQIDGFSAHADQSELLRWLSSFQSPPKRLFIVHGEREIPVLFSNSPFSSQGFHKIPNLLSQNGGQF